MTVYAEKKVCSLCGEEKSLVEDFHAQKKSSDGRQSRCKSCATGVAKEDYYSRRKERIAAITAWRKANPDKANRYGYVYKLKNLGLTLDDYEAMLAAQNNRCAICKTSEPGRGRRWFCVDHDHQTGVVRGLLCMNCNDGLGRYGDNPETLRRAANYLEGDF